MNIVRDTIRIVSIETGVDPTAIRHTRYRGARGAPAPVLARWKTWRRLRAIGWSYPRIARAFGGLHHTTILHGVRRLQELGA